MSHEHEWKPIRHFDGCHYFGWEYACECGLHKTTTQERDICYDPWSAVWMTGDEGEPMCERCEKLLTGADLLPPLEVTK